MLVSKLYWCVKKILNFKINCFTDAINVNCVSKVTQLI
jgi:hypothetical protein